MVNLGSGFRPHPEATVSLWLQPPSVPELPGFSSILAEGHLKLPTEPFNAGAPQGLDLVPASLNPFGRLQNLACAGCPSSAFSLEIRLYLGIHC